MVQTNHYWQPTSSSSVVLSSQSGSPSSCSVWRSREGWWADITWCLYPGHAPLGQFKLVYAAVYWPVRIIDLGQIYYRPPQNSKCACSVMLSGVCPTLTRLDDNLYAAVLCTAGIQLPNEYVYRTNSMEGSRDKIWAPKWAIYFFLCSIVWRYTKSPLIFCIVSHTQASSNARTQRDQLQRCNLLAKL